MSEIIIQLEENTKNKFMILDIETTGGFIQNIVQIAYNILNNDYKLIKTQNIIINNNNEQDFYKRISLEEIKNGTDIETALNNLKTDLKYCKYIIGHNIKTFDIKILNNKAKENKMSLIFPNIIDTMTKTKKYVNAKEDLKIQI